MNKKYPKNENTPDQENKDNRDSQQQPDVTAEVTKTADDIASADKPIHDNVEQPTATAAAATPDDENDVATAEEMEAFIKSRREKRNNDKKKSSASETLETEEKHETDDFYANDSALDPYLEPDPVLPKVDYKETPLLWRGCNHCPASYVPVSNTEIGSCAKVNAHNWMRGIRQPMGPAFDCVEVRFKNNRKDFFRLPDGIDVTEGDVVAVEGMPGHDVGIVSLTGEACRLQMQKKKVNPDSENIRKLFRRAKASDIERWVESIKDENTTLVRTRQIAEDLGLVMKVNDVEYQGDHSKAIFYYTADERVDFRTLIKVLAEQFKVRIEMKQIGVRQESGKVGGIGTCGRELCCSTWLTNFKSVTTSVAKTQQILPNPQKLAGQCGKLKCCLNFEYDVYVDALKQFPPAGTAIRFQKGLALYKKTDVFRGIMWYAYEGENDLYAITADNVKKIIEMNKNQQYPERLEDYQVELMSTAALAQESSDDEFDLEIRRMADDGQPNEGSSTDESGNDNNGRQQRRQQRSDRQEGRGRQQREGREGHENREPRENREQREGRNRDREPRKSRGDQKRNDNRRNPNPTGDASQSQPNDRVSRPQGGRSPQQRENQRRGPRSDRRNRDDHRANNSNTPTE